MKDQICSVCLGAVEAEDAPILTMSGAGVARCLCASCAEDIEVATGSRDYDEITAAMGRLGANLSEKNIDDPLTVAVMADILDRAGMRAAMIKSGEYDFSVDEQMAAEVLEEIPEDMLESEEDKALDEAEEARYSKIDKVLNWVWAIVLAGTIGFLVWWFIFR